MGQYKSARIIALTLYEQEYKQTQDIDQSIKNAVEKAITLFSDVDKNLLISDLKESINISVGNSFVLQGKDIDYKPWLTAENKTQTKWTLWERYRRYLLEEKRWGTEVVQSLDNTTDDILGLIQNPKVDHPFDRRGLVVGYVQSGKTANFTGVINKAIDAGYKLIIVLAGMHNSLRSQTQMRLDEEVLGFETSKKIVGKIHEAVAGDKRIGVTTLTGENFVNVGFLTSRDEKGDFNRRVANQITIQPGSIPFLLVVKKNASVLKNLLDYFRDDSPLAKHDAKSNLKSVSNVPLLIIDDEADQASVNTGDITDEDGSILQDYEPSKINKLIRELYVTFDQRAYIGYTATPFANIYIHDTAVHEQYGAELFPSSFIISLPKPSSYTGPAEVFGLSEDDDSEEQPIIRIVDDGERLIKESHKKTDVPNILPDSLIKAMYSFLLSTAIRRVRGQKKVHNSMLIHVTRFNVIQNKITLMVEEQKNKIRRQLRYGEASGNSLAIKDELKSLWVQDYLPTSKKMRGDKSTEEWEDIEKELLPAMESIIVKEINGSAGDVLDYKDNSEDGINVIAVGGDKLSRGLTLEGLTVSYYLRASRMYDTLMQMGRWFGYRVGYEDLCRLYTTKDLFKWFRHIGVAMEELRAEFQLMASRKSTPDEFGLRVRAHPIMEVTSRLKMKTGTPMKMSYKCSISETTIFNMDEDVLDRNFSATETFLRTLGQPDKDFKTKLGHEKNDSHYFWPNVDGARVVQFLEQYTTHSDAVRANSRLLANYITNQIGYQELTDWTIVLISINETKDFYQKRIADLAVNCVTRNSDNTSDRYNVTSIRRLVTPSHELLDFGPDQLENIKVKSDGDKIQNIMARRERSSEKGLLMIYLLNPTKLEVSQTPVGIALSFPDSETAAQVDYVANNVYMENELL
ncbi:Z1 domain-containing protein [Cohnella sp. WQ 127256]|uniref:Z1 domain-containing protein n=1 Tax=Cohnella sp. WQ 127256 TaxID=2938790 RepID=UPI0021184D06|nr:Z1 domain-containing protein [Cohnella sp. WQ 127256]